MIGINIPPVTCSTGPLLIIVLSDGVWVITSIAMTIFPYHLQLPVLLEDPAPATPARAAPAAAAALAFLLLWRVDDTSDTDDDDDLDL